jgi:hypothetical protein
MAKQFVYQDAHGILYPAHAALAFQPGLVPGWYDTDTRTFTPAGNPQEQVGNIVTDAGVGTGAETVLSGLREDRGADTAPLTGVVVSEPDTAARLVETEAQLADERERVAALEAQLAILQGTLTEPSTESASDDTVDCVAEPSTWVAAPEPAEDDTTAATSRRVRKVPR